MCASVMHFESHVESHLGALSFPPKIIDSEMQWFFWGLLQRKTTLNAKFNQTSFQVEVY